MGSLLNDLEVLDPVESIPNLGELDCEKLPKQRANADVGEIITVPSNRGTIARVVTVFRMIKRLLHEPGERLRTVVLNPSTN